MGTQRPTQGLDATAVALSSAFHLIPGWRYIAFCLFAVKGLFGLETQIEARAGGFCSGKWDSKGASYGCAKPDQKN